MNDPVTFSILTPNDAVTLRTIRLEALQRFPRNYTGTYEAEVQHDEAWFAELIHHERIMGAWHATDGLIGTACLSADTRPRHEHKATLRMVYIKPEYQGKGLSRRLILALEEAEHGNYEQWLLSVDSANIPAIALYESLGFKIYGTEPRAAKLADGSYLDDVLMIKFFVYSAFKKNGTFFL